MAVQGRNNRAWLKRHLPARLSATTLRSRTFQRRLQKRYLNTTAGIKRSETSDISPRVE